MRSTNLRAKQWIEDTQAVAERLIEHIQDGHRHDEPMRRMLVAVTVAQLKELVSQADNIRAAMDERLDDTDLAVEEEVDAIVCWLRKHNKKALANKLAAREYLLEEAP